MRPKIESKTIDILPVRPPDVPHGAESAEGLRERTQYGQTEDEIAKNGITPDALNETPPVSLNLALLLQDESMHGKLKRELEGKLIRIAVFGIATARGIESVLSFARRDLGASNAELIAVDINPTILREVEALNLPNVATLNEDARKTSMPNESIDLLIRDHIGNCCPPMVDRAVDREAVRVLRPNGWSITNITTSELLTQSPKRSIIPFSTLLQLYGTSFVCGLQEDFFDLEEIARSGRNNSEFLRGVLLEIEREGSFAIFGSGQSDCEQNVDLVGHGEWFRQVIDHISLWTEDGFVIEEIRSRSGFDSHVPKLQCLRHIVLLRKPGESI